MGNANRPSLLVFAYVCSPEMGTEPGAGWGVITALSEFADLTVLTGSRYNDHLDEWRTANPDSPIKLVEVSDRRVGPWTRWHRIPEFLYYLTWLRRARKKANQLISTVGFDLAVHATFSAFWLPTPATKLGIPSVWGPVGGAVTTPRSLRDLLGRAGIAQEILDYASVRLMAALPASRRSAVRATQRIFQNEETRAMVPDEARTNSRILNHSQFTVVPEFPPQEDGRYALWVSPMESRKGPQLALEALAKTTSDINLKMVGDGPQRKHLETTAVDLGVADRVTFTGLVPREEAVRLMRGATTVLFTGLREEGGLALAEAMYAARRIIVLDHGGAGSIARTATDLDRVALIPPNDVAEVAQGFAEAVHDHFNGASVADTPLLDRGQAVAELRSAVMAALEE